MRILAIENLGDIEFHDGLDINLGSIKMEISTFQIRNVPEAYLEWKKKWS